MGDSVKGATVKPKKRCRCYTVKPKFKMVLHYNHKWRAM